MVCRPCQEKAEKRRQAMAKQIALNNPKAAEHFNANVIKLPRYEGESHPITNNEYKPKTIWNEGYQTFVMNNK